MEAHMGLDSEIDQLKRLLEQTARQHKYNFMHPKVIALSQKLDDRIVQIMKDRKLPHTS